MDHPFWKTAFTLSDPADLQSLRVSRVPFFWIDTALGLDAADAASAVQSPPPNRRPSRRRRPTRHGRSCTALRPSSGAAAAPC